MLALPSVLILEPGSSWTAGSPTPTPLVVVRQEALHVEGALLAQHQIDGPAELGGKDGERLGFAMTARETTQMLL